VEEFIQDFFVFIKVIILIIMDPCLNGVHGTECGTGNGRGNTVLREREHRSRMDDLRRREEVNRNFFQTFENVSKRFAKKFLNLFIFRKPRGDSEKQETGSIV